MRSRISTRFGNTSLRITSKLADHWIGKLFDAFEAIGKTPGLGHRREDLTAYPVLFWPVDVGTNADVAGLKACSTKLHSRNQMWGGRPRPRRTPGPAFPASEQADQGSTAGQGARPTKTVAAREEIKIL